MRDTTARLCAEFARVGAECFDQWCDLFDNRGDPSPSAVIASQAVLHEAVARLRDWCQADPVLADAERRQLMVSQAKGDLAAAAAVQAHRSAADRNRLRRAWAAASRDLLHQRATLTCGLGWPHRGEPVIVTLGQDADGDLIPETGNGIYLHSGDVYNATHQVWLPRLGPRRLGTVSIRWLPSGTRHGPLEPADPAGGIGLRVTADPERDLPVPLMNWPKAADVGLDVPAPGVAPSPDQRPLFRASHGPAPAAGARPRAAADAAPARGRNRRPTTP